VNAWWRQAARVYAGLDELSIKPSTTHAHAYAGLGELKQLCMELNIMVEDAVLSGIIALADHDGGGDISYAEFARVLTADDVMKMKDTLRAA
jgi:hypothetical protein